MARTSTKNALGIGILGAGPVTQAIHLPVIATMPELFRVVQVMDVDTHVAQAVAARCDAAFATTIEPVIVDPAVDVVAICSPNAFHAQQVLAACAAGKKAILCEKPLAVSRAEADLILEATLRSGTRLLVGTMHAFDPAYRAAHTAWLHLDQVTRHVHSSILLPSNNAFIDQATDQVAVPPPPGRAGGLELEARQRMFRQAMLGLAIHNVPLIRDFYGEFGTVKHARYLVPFGYSATLANAGATTVIEALMPGRWPPKWRFRVLGASAELCVDFPPSYVLAGSATARIVSGGNVSEFRFAENGYEAQWRHLHRMISEDAEPLVALGTAIGDLRFALDLADQGVAAMGAT